MRDDYIVAQEEEETRVSANTTGKRRVEGLGDSLRPARFARVFFAIWKVYRMRIIGHLIQLSLEFFFS